MRVGRIRSDVRVGRHIEISMTLLLRPFNIELRKQVVDDAHDFWAGNTAGVVTDCDVLKCLSRDRCRLHSKTATVIPCFILKNCETRRTSTTSICSNYAIGC